MCVGVCARVLAWVSYFVSPHDIGKDAYWEIRMFLFDFFHFCAPSVLPAFDSKEMVNTI